MKTGSALGAFIGGTRSGKSKIAQSWLLQSHTSIEYVATLGADHVLSERVVLHKSTRSRQVDTIELENGDQLLQVIKHAQKPLLIDSLGTWLTRYKDFEAPLARLIEELESATQDIAVVGELVGDGIHGQTELERSFIDRLGEANQALRGLATHSYLVVAGGVVSIIEPTWGKPNVL